MRGWHDLRHGRIILLFALALACGSVPLKAYGSSCGELASLIAEERNDGTLASRLSAIQLTQRFDQVEVTGCLPKPPGPRSREALQVIADESAFWDQPATWIPARPEPSIEEQRRIMRLAVEYVATTMHRLPNFFALQRTERFETQPRGYEEKGTITARVIPLRPVGKMDAIVTYRNGNEVESKQPGGNKAREEASRGLRAWGFFGPILAIALHDAGISTAVWSHWERRGSQSLAVFRYKVPFQNSNYQVTFCCAPGYAGMLEPIDRRAAYHGEIALDPDTGAILRLTLQADLDQADLSTGLREAALGNPLTRADLAVDYGPVQIGGTTYICPVHSVAVSRAHTIAYHKTGRESLGLTLGPEKLYINDSVIENYHLFRSESRILPASQ